MPDSKIGVPVNIIGVQQWRHHCRSPKSSHTSGSNQECRTTTGKRSGQRCQMPELESRSTSPESSSGDIIAGVQNLPTLLAAIKDPELRQERAVVNDARFQVPELECLSTSSEPRSGDILIKASSYRPAEFDKMEQKNLTATWESCSLLELLIRPLFVDLTWDCHRHMATKTASSILTEQIALRISTPLLAPLHSCNIR
ncbi:uncharacterized protein [Periplaneta americana]|uniref:uncharacterized protein n=1 Tax=Periplaneta americana TaxID=6978 RepID=UPI0037E9B560